MKEDQGKKKILVIEDEIHIADVIRLNLELKGYIVELADSGTGGVHKWKQWRPDLIVLDIMLPGIDGWNVLQSIRLEDERIPILILSAKAASADRVKGLRYGVDDYLSKPFELEEFLLRINRLITRSSWSREGVEDAGGDTSSLRSYSFGGNLIDFVAQTAHCRGGTVSLTEQEIKLLKLFISNKGRPLSRQQLLEIGWGYARDTTSRTLDNFIVRFRKYFEDDPKKPVYFKSRRSVGYIFDHD